jgi:chromosome segregation ATPase
MSIAKTIDDLEKHLDYAQSYLKELQDDVDRELQDADDEIKTLNSQIEELEEEADNADTKIQELMYQNSMLQLELTEVTNELIALRSDNMTKAGIILHLKHELVILGKNI